VIVRERRRRLASAYLVGPDRLLLAYEHARRVRLELRGLHGAGAVHLRAPRRGSLSAVTGDREAAFVEWESD